MLRHAVTLRVQRQIGGFKKGLELTSSVVSFHHSCVLDNFPHGMDKKILTEHRWAEKMEFITAMYLPKQQHKTTNKSENQYTPKHTCTQ